MGGTYIENYERNLIENAFNEGYKEGFKIGNKMGIKEVKNDIAMKMKADGVSLEFIFKYCGVWL